MRMPANEDLLYEPDSPHMEKFNSGSWPPPISSILSLNASALLGGNSSQKSSPIFALSWLPTSMSYWSRLACIPANGLSPHVTTDLDTRSPPEYFPLAPNRQRTD
jgi:hypothetical protein